MWPLDWFSFILNELAWLLHKLPFSNGLCDLDVLTSGLAFNGLVMIDDAESVLVRVEPSEAASVGNDNGKT